MDGTPKSRLAAECRKSHFSEQTQDSNNEKIIGSSWLTNDGRRLYLHHFCILPKYQSKGLSKTLLDKSLAFAKEVNLQIKLEVHRDNTIAKELYHKGGFKYLGDYEVYIIRDVNLLKLRKA
ncbi:MAG: hypothetical protein DRJ10_18120 [Bacteroidetes bacterium]|nr:MAG: hypothetical protein DRJ10_18120 [Bacteroidota bacterium]